ncbi:MAG: patatin-like phospholipase family protein [Rhodoferax sp.]|uniref:patatin-like phospholipase family protein n=1 Tax=Rhodoferax sp. TaxID=50421 RepID=UPI002639EC18|nr:patatin-like phospholipase family protein [Rhodoferax sp.]MDD2881318.1 patatin-like phospholipase family protein [Rhodoferax sp.]
MHFDNIVFAGGGNRCFWQAGFWSVAANELDLKPSGVVSVSAGSAMACALFAGTFDHGFAGFKQAIADNQRNLYLANLLHKQPVFPHGKLYRNAILGSIDGQALTRLHHGPEIFVLIACPPQWATGRLAFLLGMVAVGLDACNTKAVHACGGRRVGFKPLYLSVRECATPNELADLIIASSCVPPLTPQAKHNGRAIFDGGLVSNVPTDGVPQKNGQTLVLLTRQFPNLPRVEGRTYVQPSQPIPAGAWDYTNDAALQATFDLGRRDGDRFCTSASGSRP